MRDSWILFKATTVVGSFVARDSKGDIGSVWYYSSCTGVCSIYRTDVIIERDPKYAALFEEPTNVAECSATQGSTGGLEGKDTK